MRWPIKAALAALLCCCASARAATTYYVDWDLGSDANNGTAKATPWRTIPGTRNAGDTDYLNTAWGSVTTSARITDNTTIYVNGVYTASEGNYVWVSAGSGAFYNEGFTNLVIERDVTWSNSIPTINASNMAVAIAAIVVQIDGVTLRGFDVHQSSKGGVQFKEKAGSGDPLTNCIVASMTFSNNATSYASDPAGSGDAQLWFRHGVNVTLTNSTFYGDTNFTQGAMFGDNSKRVLNGYVADCTARDHRGDEVTDNDSGMGFKAFNSQLIFTNCFSIGNLKGWDCGEQSGSWDITYKLFRCRAFRNSWGVGLNTRGSAFAFAANFYMVNCYVISNSYNGLNCYAGPFKIYVTHCLFDTNGYGATLYNAGQVAVNPNDNTDTNLCRAYFRNNIFRRGGPNAPVYLVKYHGSTNRFTIASDYNAYEQGSEGRFCYYSPYITEGNTDFAYGANGPGHASGNWYSWYSDSTTPPAYETGHFHDDVNSRGTGCDVTTQPPFTDFPNADYTLTTDYAGADLSGESWYIAEMGRDFNGVTRSGSTWDVGPHEYSAGGGAPGDGTRQPSVLRRFGF